MMSRGLLDGDDGVAAVDGSVQGRVQGLGVGAELDGEAGALAGGGVSSLGGGSIGSTGGVGRACGTAAGSQELPIPVAIAAAMILLFFMLLVSS